VDVEGSLAWTWVAIWAHLTQPGISQEQGRGGQQHHGAGSLPRALSRGAMLTSFHSLLPEPCTKRTTTAERGAALGCCTASRLCCAPCLVPPPTWVRLGEGVHVQQVPGVTEPGVSHPGCHPPGPTAGPRVLPLTRGRQHAARPTPAPRAESPGSQG